MHAHAYGHINTLVKYVYYFLFQTAVSFFDLQEIYACYKMEIIFMPRALIAYWTILCVFLMASKENVLSKSFVGMLFTWPTFWLTWKQLCFVGRNGEGYDLWDRVADRCQQAMSSQGICCKRDVHMLSHMGAWKELCNSEHTCLGSPLWKCLFLNHMTNWF